MEKNDLNLRSEEIQDIMQKPPAWIIRWGITTVFIIILMGLFLSWLIKYPEIISGAAKLTTRVPPIKIISQTSGKMTQLFVKDGQDVKEGDILAEIENPLSANGIKYIENYLNLLSAAIAQNQSRLPVPDTTNLALGDLQSVFNDLQRELTTYNLNKYHKIDDAQILELRQHIKNQEDLLAINQKMIGITKKELENATLKFESDMVLFKNNVISKQEFYQKQTEYNNKQLQLEQLEQTKVQNEVALNNLKLQLSQGVYTKDSKNFATLDAIRSHQKSINNYIFGWQQKFRLVAVMDGKISYLNNLQTNQFLKAGEEIFALFQPGDSVIALAEVPVAGFGKVKSGQKVHLLLDNFPHHDFGMLEGKVTKIALLPNSNFYRVEISLLNGMNSTQKKVLKFTPEMLGMAEIITDDKTVMQRIFKSIIKLFDHT
jgi:multidrug efflux pump subunit AcrA (membrane-fusion protein)